MKKSAKKKREIIITLAAVLVLIAISIYVIPKETRGMMVLIEFEDVDGLKNWANDLERREIPGVVQIQHHLVDFHCDVIKDISDRGFEVSGLYASDPFWNMDYDIQYEKMKEVKDKLEDCTGRKMKSFASRYFAYDETTLRVAEELEIEYIFARGTTGARATVYKPEEYNVKIISVSNVPYEDMGTGSLCDYSLWARGATPQEFEKTTLDVFRKEDNVILVSHAYLGGAKLRWWNSYQKILNDVNAEWFSLEEFCEVYEEMPNQKIPVNTEVEYHTPRPEIPFEEEPECPHSDLICY